MSAPQNLTELYIDELKDLWSANDQMQKCVKKMAAKASDKKLMDMLTRSQDGFAKHTDMLKELIAAHGEKVSKEHCKGMEGLVAEATKHTTTEEAPANGPVLDAVIIAQYQRMTHYGIAGFGTAAAFANPDISPYWSVNEDGIALVCSKIEVSNLNQTSGRCRNQTVPKKLMLERWTLGGWAAVWWRAGLTGAA